MPRVLVVEDEAIVALSLQRTLVSMGHEVSLAGSADEAVAEATTAAPDLALMDIRLKGDTDGITAGAQIQQQSGACIIFLTAYSDAATLARAARMGPASYLVKPFTADQVRAAVGVALAAREQVQREVPPAARRLAGGVAHNMNSLLTVVQGHGELLGRHLAPAGPARRHLHGMLDASGRGAELARQLLDYAGCRMHVDPAQIDLQALVAGVLPALRALLEPRFEVAAHLASVPPTWLDQQVVGDVLFAIADWVQEALAGPGRVLISTVAAGDGAEVQVCIEAQDTELTALQRRQLLEPFALLSDTRPVAGLQLPAAFGLMRQCGATLEVEPGPNHGIRFRLAFPASGGA